MDERPLDNSRMRGDEVNDDHGDGDGDGDGTVVTVMVIQSNFS